MRILKYPIYVAEQGRGQIYPDGARVTYVYNATAGYSKQIYERKGGMNNYNRCAGRQVIDSIPQDQNFFNPNVGDLVRETGNSTSNPLRVQGLLFFLASVILAKFFGS
uniref:Uncharacterized protein n=1 Tax=Salix viminalis TaxID=40686 RepID=A0A6N2NE84_SALVM